MVLGDDVFLIDVRSVKKRTGAEEDATRKLAVRRADNAYRKTVEQAYRAAARGTMKGCFFLRSRSCATAEAFRVDMQGCMGGMRARKGNCANGEPWGCGRAFAMR